MTPARDVRVPDAHRRLLSSWVRAGTTPQRVVTRARIVLMAGEGASIRAIAAKLQVSPRTVMLWRRRYLEDGPDALRRDAPGRGRKPSVGTDAATARLRELLATTPAGGGRWSVRRLATLTGLSAASVHRLMRMCDLETRPRSSFRTRKRHVFPSLFPMRDLPV